MQEQTQIHNRQLIPERRVVEYHIQVLSTEWRQDLRQKELPDHWHHNALIRDEARESPLNTRHLGLTDATLMHGFGYPLHDGATRQDDAQHEEGQRFLLMPMNSCQQLFELLLPVRPEYTRTIH